MILPLEQVEAASAGGKAVGLRRLREAGVAVPEAFVIDARAFLAHVERAGATADGVRATALAPELLDPLREAWRGLGDVVVAVRSSGVDEDGADASFAGQHDTVLGVATFDALVDAVRACWASAFSQRAIAYRAHVGAPAPSLAVVVQRMIEPRVAGVVFTRSPEPTKDVLVLEAVRGRGEALVSGHAAPERLEVDRASPQAQASALLAPRELQQLTTDALALEAHFGEPLDLEWALDAEGRLWWLQARPITTALSHDDPSLVWSNTNAGELLPDVATPMTLDLVKNVVKMLFALFTEALDMDFDRTPVVGLVGGRVYFSMNTFAALAAQVPGMSKRSPAELFGGHATEIVAGLKQVGAQARPVVGARGLRLVRGVATMVWRMLRQSGVRPDAEVEVVLAETRALATFDVRGATDDALLAWLRRLQGGMGPIFNEVFGAIAVGMACTNALLERSRHWLGDADGAIGSALLAGLGGVDSAEAGLELWKLGERLREAGLGELLARRDAAGLLDALERHPELLAAWRAWNERHGHHARAELDVSQPRWRERPEQVLGLLAGERGARTPVEVFAATAARREQVEAESLRRLSPLRRLVFRALLERARRGTRLRELLKSEAVRRLALTREGLLEVGQRAVSRGVLSERDDVFFVQWADVPALLRATDGAPWKRKVQRARAERKKWLPLTPPPVVIGRLDPTRALPPPVPQAPVLRGLAVSAGLVEGVARVVLRSDEDTRVAPGEILVAPFTDPGWSPWFISAGALVVDLGGMLSHGSIIAREYGIPAVVNVGHATRRIRSGSRIRVDGFRGEVTILEE
ncbi:MAG: PEP/pyruvate-binding domain-containing protein [Myxococcota bacterium]